MTTLRPTHSCFDDAFNFFVVVVMPDELAAHREHFRIVHAMCKAPGNEAPYAHAWVEEAQPDGAIAWQAGYIESGELIYYAVTVPELMRVHGVMTATRYRPELAADIAARKRSAGPWRPEYIAACATRDGAPRIIGAARYDRIVHAISPAPAPRTHAPNRKRKATL